MQTQTSTDGRRGLAKPEILRFAVWLLFFSLFSSASGIGLATALIGVFGAALFWPRRSEIPSLPLFWPILILCAAMALSVAVNPGTGFAKPLLKMKYFGIYFLLVFTFAAFPTLRQRLARAAVGLCLFLAVIALLQFTGFFDPLPALHLLRVELAVIPQSNGHFFHARGLLYHHNPFGLGCLMLFHLMLGQLLTTDQKKERAWYAAAMVACVLCIVTSGSRGAWLGLVLSCTVIAVTVARKHWRVFLGIAVALLVFALALSSGVKGRFETLRPSKNSERLELWRICTEMFRDHPLLGTGYHRGFELNRERYMTSEEKANPYFPTDPHSAYFDFLATTGLFGFLAFLGFLVSAVGLYLRALVSRAAALSRESQAFLITGLGSLLCFTIGAAFDSHFFHTETLNMTLFFLALGQSVVWSEATDRRGFQRAGKAQIP